MQWVSARHRCSGRVSEVSWDGFGVGTCGRVRRHRRRCLGSFCEGRGGASRSGRVLEVSWAGFGMGSCVTCGKARQLPLGRKLTSKLLLHRGGSRIWWQPCRGRLQWFSISWIGASPPQQWSLSSRTAGSVLAPCGGTCRTAHHQIFIIYWHYLAWHHQRIAEGFCTVVLGPWRRRTRRRQQSQHLGQPFGAHIRGGTTCFDPEQSPTTHSARLVLNSKVRCMQSTTPHNKSWS